MHNYLLSNLVSILGFPATIRSMKGVADGVRALRLPESKELAIRLFGPRGVLGSDWLVLSTRATSDAFCRKMANRFAGLGRHVAEDCKRPWDIKAALIRQEQFLWDNAVVGVWYSGNQKYNVLNLLGAIREVLSFQYEGNAIDVGVLASWNWHDVEPRLKAAGCTMLKFASKFDLRDQLRKQKTMHLLADGKSSLFVTSPYGLVRSWLSFPNREAGTVSAEWTLVPTAFRHLEHILTGRDLVLAATANEEVFFLRHDSVLKWARHRWYRVSGPPLEEQLAPHLTTDAAAVVAQLVVELSGRRVGSLIAIATDVKHLLRLGSKGLAYQFGNGPMFTVDQVSRDTLMRLAAVDGCIIVDRKGLVWNAGVIINLPASHVTTAEGARAAAAEFASTFGLAIKVSHDGPISIYENGNLIRAA